MYCRELAGPHGKLIVALDTDERIKKNDPKLPIFNQDIRLINLDVLKVNGNPIVDRITMFTTDDDLREIIRVNKPDYIVKGDEWKGKEIIGSDLVKGRILFYQTEKNGIADKISSSAIVKTILERYNIKN